MGVAVGLVAALVLAGALAAPVAALASPGKTATKVVRYHGYRVVVPAGWPVYRLTGEKTTCVRFDRHAVYLGHPGADQRCPATAAGRTEAILVAPLGSSTGAAGAAGAAAGQPLPLPSTQGAVPARGSATQFAKDGVVVTATWHQDPAVIKRALGFGSLPKVSKAVARPSAALAIEHATRAAKAASARSQPGAVFTGEGFDACSTPSGSQMSAWGASPYRAAGVYIGGTNMACSQPNLTPSWVGAQAAAGWHLIPIYVGLQAPGNDCGCAAISSASAATEGAAAARDAVSEAQSIGLALGNPLYFDMEAYNPSTSTTATVLRFLGAWTTQLHASGYLSGVYSSAASGIQDLASEMGTGYAEPNDIWIASWNGARNTLDADVPSADWSSHQRLHQYDGAHNETYGGYTLNIDGDYVDAATAAAGAGVVETPQVAAAPSLSVSAQTGGAIDLRPSWPGRTGVSTWQALAGATPSSLAVVAATVSARKPLVIDSAYSYFQVRAVGSTGQSLGSSPVVATPAHLALIGKSAFVPKHGVGGLPVQCFKATPCSVTTTVSLGRSILASTGPELVPAGGGVVYFSLSPVARTLLARAPHRRLPVNVVVHDVSGIGVTGQVNLVAFTTSGLSPRHSLQQGPLLKIIGATDFVSAGWSGGILAACESTTPCRATTSLVAAGRRIAVTPPETLGVDEVGYLPFVLTAAGHRVLATAHGNQLAVRLTVTTTGTLGGNTVTSVTGGPALTGGGTAVAGPATAVTGTATASIVLASF